MRQYVEPICELLTIDPVTVVCGSTQFDSVDSTELFTIETFELI